MFSNLTLSKYLRDNNIAAVPHGFRSSFRNWANDNYIDRQQAEFCLAHVGKTEVEGGISY